MPLECAFKQRHGRQFCVTDCPASAPCGIFEYVRVERPEDVPAADPRAIDVAVLDMNHGWPNLGHDSLVHAIMDASCETIEALEEAGLRVRVLSFDVRRSGVLPEAPGGRLLALRRHGRPRPHRPARERRGGALRPGRAREPRLGGARLPPVRRDPRAARTRRSSPSATRSASCAAGRARPSPVLRGPEKGKCTRRPRERARLAGRRAPLVPPLRRAPRAERAAPRRREPALRPHPAPGPARLGRPHRLRDARRRGRARRRGHDDRVRPGPRRASCPACSR